MEGQTAHPRPIRIERQLIMRCLTAESPSPRFHIATGPIPVLGRDVRESHSLVQWRHNGKFALHGARAAREMAVVADLRIGRRFTVKA